MAEKEGFEPPVALPRQLISSQSHSTTLPLLLQLKFHTQIIRCLFASFD